MSCVPLQPCFRQGVRASAGAEQRQCLTSWLNGLVGTTTTAARRTCSARSWSLGLAASCLFLAVSICRCSPTGPIRFETTPNTAAAVTPYRMICFQHGESSLEQGNQLVLYLIKGVVCIWQP